jgi:hypothetical protein
MLGYAWAMGISQVSLSVMALVSLAMLVAAVWAFVDALAQRKEAYVAADKLTKPAWLLILGLGLGAQLLFFGGIGLLNLLAIVAALVYLVDVRPAIRSLTRR